MFLRRWQWRSSSLQEEEATGGVSVLRLLTGYNHHTDVCVTWITNVRSVTRQENTNFKPFLLETARDRMSGSPKTTTCNISTFALWRKQFLFIYEFFLLLFVVIFKLTVLLCSLIVHSLTKKLFYNKNYVRAVSVTRITIQLWGFYKTIWENDIHFDNSWTNEDKKMADFLVLYNTWKKSQNIN